MLINFSESQKTNKTPKRGKRKQIQMSANSHELWMRWLVSDFTDRLGK